MYAECLYMKLPIFCKVTCWCGKFRNSLNIIYCAINVECVFCRQESYSCTNCGINYRIIGLHNTFCKYTHNVTLLFVHVCWHVQHTRVLKSFWQNNLIFTYCASASLHSMHTLFMCMKAIVDRVNYRAFMKLNFILIE